MTPVVERRGVRAPAGALWHGLARFIMVWPGHARHGHTRPGHARHAPPWVPVHVPPRVHPPPSEHQVRYSGTGMDQE